MMGFSTIWLFVMAAATLLILPGPAVFHIMARSIEQEKKAGLISVLGVSLGGSVHVLAGAIGVSAQPKHKRSCCDSNKSLRKMNGERWNDEIYHRG